MSEKSLRAIAAALGITISVPAGPEAESYLVSLLQAAGQPISEADDADALLQQIEQEQQVIDPVQVVDISAMPVSVPIRLLVGDERCYTWILTEENGTSHQGGVYPQ